MKIYNFLKSNKRVIGALIRYGIKLHYVNYLEHYDRYMKMRKEGGKATCVADDLGRENGMCSRSFMRVVHDLNQEIDF